MNTIRICFANKVEKNKNVLHREIREPKLNAFIDRHASAEAGTWIYLWSQQNTETAMNIATAWHRLNKKKKWRCWFFVIFLYAALFICSDFGLNTTKAAKKCDPFHTYLLVKISILCSFLSGFLSICLNEKKGHKMYGGSAFRIFHMDG